VSIASVQSRVAQLESLIAAASSPRATTFAATLASATAQPGAGAASLSSPLASTATAGTGSTAAAIVGGSSGAGATGSSAAMLSPGAASSLPAGTPYGAEITAAAKRHGIDPALLAGLIKQESGFNPDARSGAGAVGLTQLMPATAAGLGVTDPANPAQSIEGGAKYLAGQLKRFGGDVARALAAYNAGPGAVERFGGVPPYAETQNYVRAVQANAARFRASTPTPSTV
jgi:soluble lytic murein transglycosylase-like protein